MIEQFMQTIRGATRTIAATEAVTVRKATEADHRPLLRLAALDSSPPLQGELVVAEVDGEVRAARSLRDGRAIADPFRPTATLLELLEVRARQLAYPGIGQWAAQRTRYGMPFRSRRLRGAL